MKTSNDHIRIGRSSPRENRCDSYGDRIENRCKEQSIRATRVLDLAELVVLAHYLAYSTLRLAYLGAQSPINYALLLHAVFGTAAAAARRGRSTSGGTQARRADASNENAPRSGWSHATCRSSCSRPRSFDFWRWISRGCLQRTQRHARRGYDTHLYFRLHAAQARQHRKYPRRRHSGGDSANDRLGSCARSNRGRGMESFRDPPVVAVTAFLRDSLDVPR